MASEEGDLVLARLLSVDGGGGEGTGSIFRGSYGIASRIVIIMSFACATQISTAAYILLKGKLAISLGKNYFPSGRKQKNKFRANNCPQQKQQLRI